MFHVLMKKERPVLWIGAAILLAAILTVTLLQVPGFAADAKTATKYNYQEKIKEYAANNSDVQGWVYIEGTNVNYPVIFYPEDTFHYNALGYNKEYSVNGVIWADAYTKGGSSGNMSQNTVLYGHNWTNYSASPRVGNSSDVMFAQLTAFHHLDFAKEHQFINYCTNEENFVYQVFAAFYTEKDFVYNRSDPNSTQWDEIVGGARERSLHDYDLSVGSSDKIITLSTCTRAYGSSHDQRFVVMGKLVSSGTEMTTVTANADYKKPNV